MGYDSSLLIYTLRLSYKLNNLYFDMLLTLKTLEYSYLIFLVDGGAALLVNNLIFLTIPANDFCIPRWPHTN